MHDHACHVRDGKRLAVAFWLIAGFTIIELAGAYFSNSLTLWADAGHMLLDASALALSWSALRLARRRSARLTYGYHRYEVLAAFVNGLGLLALCGWILFEAAGRLRAPSAVLPLPMLWVATVGLAVNVVAYRLLHGSENLNVRSAALHVLGDLLGSVAAICAALAMLLFGWWWMDPLLALAVVAIIGRGVWSVLKESASILLEAAPPQFDAGAVRETLTAQVPGVLAIHHIHAWALTGDRPLLTLHARVERSADAGATLRRIKSVLAETFGIEHSTVQIDHGACPDEAGSCS